MTVETARYWLLDSVVEFELPLDLLVSSVLEETLNRRGHGLPYEALIVALHELFEDGDLFAQHMSNFLSRTRAIKEPTTGKPIPRKPIGEQFSPTRLEIEVGLRGEIPINYGLTLQGGAKWEEISQPRWEQYLVAGYIQEISKETPECEAEIIAADR
jgi:hypothetical protein